jgi:hypothetical protein
MLLKLGERRVEITPSVFHQNTRGGVGSMDVPPKAGDQRRMVLAEEYLRDKVTIANLLVKADLGCCRTAVLQHHQPAAIRASARMVRTISARPSCPRSACRVWQ